MSQTATVEGTSNLATLLAALKRKKEMLAEEIESKCELDFYMLLSVMKAHGPACERSRWPSTPDHALRKALVMGTSVQKIMK